VFTRGDRRGDRCRLHFIHHQPVIYHKHFKTDLHAIVMYLTYIFWLTGFCVGDVLLQ